MSPDSVDVVFGEFVKVIKALRTPVTGCPWDLKQDHQSLRRYLVEESYEVLDAIDRQDDSDLCDELGDILLQVVLHAQVAHDRKAFDIVDVVKGITAKMIRRHPHVFGDTQVSSSEEVLSNWEKIKQEEKKGKPSRDSNNQLASITPGLPGLLRAQRVLEKVDHLQPQTGRIMTAAAEESVDPVLLGEELLNLVQKARKQGLSAEDCLREATERFIKTMATVNEPPPANPALE